MESTKGNDVNKFFDALQLRSSTPIIGSMKRCADLFNRGHNLYDTDRMLQEELIVFLLDVTTFKNKNVENSLKEISTLLIEHCIKEHNNTKSQLDLYVDIEDKLVKIAGVIRGTVFRKKQGRSGNLDDLLNLINHLPENIKNIFPKLENRNDVNKFIESIIKERQGEETTQAVLERYSDKLISVVPNHN